MWIRLAAIALLLAPSFAYSLTGGNVLGKCEAFLGSFEESGGRSNPTFASGLARGSCLGFIFGFLSAENLNARIYESTPGFCLPEDINVKEDIVRTVVIFLKANPEHLDIDSSFLLWKVLDREFRCDPEKK